MKMLLHRLFFVLSCSLAPTVTGLLTRFHLNGTLLCPMSSFARHIQVWESDVVWSKKIGSADAGWSHTPHRYSVDAQDTGDLDVFSNSYEVSLKIWHTCDDAGVRRFLWAPLGSLPVYDGHLHHTQDIQLHNRGELTTQWKDWP